MAVGGLAFFVLTLPTLIHLLSHPGKIGFFLALASGLALLVPGIALVHHNGRLHGQRFQRREENNRLRQAIQRAEQRFRQLLDHAGDAIFFIHPETGALLAVNKVAEQLLGYPAEDIRKRPLSDLFPGQQRRRYLRLVKTVLRDGYGEEPDLLIRRADGQTFHGAVHARLGDLGEDRVVHGVLRDVTEIKRIEKELRLKNRDLALVNDIAHRAAANRDLNEMLGEILAEVVDNFNASGGGVYLLRHQGTELHLLVHRGIEPEVLTDLQRLPVGKGLVGRVAANGKPRSSPDLRKDCRVWSPATHAAGWRGFQAIPLVSDQRTVGVIFFFTRQIRLFSCDEVHLLLAIGKQVGTAVDSVELYESLQWQCRLTEASNRELEESRQQLRSSLAQMKNSNRILEQTERMKSNFLTLASHELRTPLTYVLSGAELLGNTMKGRLSHDESRMLEAIHQGGRRLHEIVQDLIDIARIESNTCPLARGKVFLPALLAEIGQEFKPVFHQRTLTFRVAELPVNNLYGDARQLGKTLRRLLENAVKFTPEGGRIEIDAQIRQGDEIRRDEARLKRFSTLFFNQPSPERLLQITVSDNGVGIDPTEHVRIFDKFYEIGSPDLHFTSRTRFGGKGVGLGLSLVKGVVEAHGGMTWVESPGTLQTGTGSAFHLLLPLPPSPEEKNDGNRAGLSGHPPDHGDHR